MRLLLCGGGSKEKTEKINSLFNEIIDHSKPLLYIPLAVDCNEKPYDSCYRWITEEMSKVDLNGIEMINTFEELADKDFNDFCALFIGGGNTFRLLEGLKRTNSFEKIRNYVNNNGIVYGGSAGAVIFGKDINSILSTDDNIVNLEDTTGYNVLNNKSLFCHYTNKKSKLTEAENEKMQQEITDSLINFSKNKGEVIALPEEDTIFINDDKVEIIGTKSYYSFKDGTITEYSVQWEGYE